MLILEKKLRVLKNIVSCNKIGSDGSQIGEVYYTWFRSSERQVAVNRTHEENNNS